MPCSKEGRWEALFTAEQINGWLAVDRAKNHPNSLPPTMCDPRVAIDSKQITFACRTSEGASAACLSLTIEPSVPEPNVLALRIVKATAGLLPLPLGQVLERLSQAARDLQLIWNGDGPAEIPWPCSPFPKVKTIVPVRIDTLRLGDGEIYVAGSTETRARNRSERSARLGRQARHACAILGVADNCHPEMTSEC